MPKQRMVGVRVGVRVRNCGGGGGLSPPGGFRRRPRRGRGGSTVGMASATSNRNGWWVAQNRVDTLGIQISQAKPQGGEHGFDIAGGVGPQRQLHENPSARPRIRHRIMVVIQFHA